MCAWETELVLDMQGGYELLKASGELHPSPIRRGNRRVIIGVLITGALCLSSFYAFWPKVHLHQDDTYQSQSTLSDSSSQQSLKQCAASIPPPAKAPAPVNLWASLTVNETVQISEWLSHPARGLNLTSAGAATLSDNVIFHIGAWRPAKADAVRYLETPSPFNLPERYARATLEFGARTAAQGGPVIKDYLVGPLPISDRTSMRELKDVYHRDDIPFNARGFAIPTELTPLLMSYMPRLADVTQVDIIGVDWLLMFTYPSHRTYSMVSHWVSKTTLSSPLLAGPSVSMDHSAAPGFPGGGTWPAPGYTLSTSSNMSTSPVPIPANGSC